MKPVLDEKWISIKPIVIRLYDPNSTLMERSNPYEASNYITYQPDREMYSDFHEWSTCDMYGCTMDTSEAEKSALIDFYD